MDFRQMCKIGMARFHGHDRVIVQVMGENWIMVSCSPISGQMSFRKEDLAATRPDESDIKKFNNHVESGTHGIESDGAPCQRDRAIPQEHLVGMVRRTCELLKYPLRAKAFVSADGGWPVVTDGDHSYALRWRNLQTYVHGRRARGGSEWHVELVILDGGKRYQVVQDPLWLDPTGHLITPLEKIMGWISDQFEVFADPMAARNTARKPKNENETKTLTPGAKINARHKEGR